MKFTQRTIDAAEYVSPHILPLTHSLTVSYGTHRPFYFFLMPSYWIDKTRRVRGKDAIGESQSLLNGEAVR